MQPPRAVLLSSSHVPCILERRPLQVTCSVVGEETWGLCPRPGFLSLLRWAWGKASATWKEEEAPWGVCFGAARVPPPQTFANESTFGKFFKAISNYPDKTHSFKTQEWLMDPR